MTRALGLELNTCELYVFSRPPRCAGPRSRRNLPEWHVPWQRTSTSRRTPMCLDIHFVAAVQYLYCWLRFDGVHDKERRFCAFPRGNVFSPPAMLLEARWPQTLSPTRVAPPALRRFRTRLAAPKFVRAHNARSPRLRFLKLRILCTVGKIVGKTAPTGRSYVSPGWSVGSVADDAQPWGWKTD